MAINQLGDGSADGVIVASAASKAGTGNVHTVTAGSTTTVFVNTSFDGSVGSTAYTVGDLVAILKGFGFLKT